MTSSEPTSFLHLPPEIRNLIYDPTFNTDIKSNILDPAHSGYTREVSPLLYVHPAISADLKQRTYGGDFSLVLPIQEPSEWARGRGLNSETLKTCLDNLPGLMKKKCERLIVEASQSDEVEDVDYEFWDSDDFPRYLVPLLLQIKEEIPTLKKITFIFWFGEWSAPLDVWKKSLKLLSRQWNKKGQSQNGKANAGKGLTKSSRAKPSIEMQFNLFDYYDQDGGDGGANEYLQWYCFAGHVRSGSGDEAESDMASKGDDEDQNDDKGQASGEGMSEDDDENEDEDDSDSDDEANSKSLGLKFTFRAMDLHWKDHVNGNFEGKEFDPNIWDDINFHTMSPKEADRAAHKYWHVTETCKPLFVKTASGSLS